MTQWLIPCNIKMYDVVSLFDEITTVDWKQSTNVEVGDIIYIYIGAPISAIAFKCKAISINLPKRMIDDTKYVIDDTNYGMHNRYMRLQLVNRYNTKKLTYSVLKEHGLKTVQSPCKITNELLKYLSNL